MGDISLNWMFHNFKNVFYFWYNFGAQSSRYKYFVLMPENKIILTCISCDFRNTAFILVKLHLSQEEAWEENLNGKVWTRKRTANNEKKPFLWCCSSWSQGINLGYFGIGLLKYRIWGTLQAHIFPGLAWLWLFILI